MFVSKRRATSGRSYHKSKIDGRVGEAFFQKGFPRKSLFLISGFLPALVAHSDIRIVTADENLATGSDDVAVLVDTGINGCFVAAGADGFDLSNGVGNLKEAAATGEEMGQKVGT